MTIAFFDLIDAIFLKHPNAPLTSLHFICGQVAIVNETIEMCFSTTQNLTGLPPVEPPPFAFHVFHCYLL